MRAVEHAESSLPLPSTAIGGPSRSLRCPEQPIAQHPSPTVPTTLTTCSQALPSLAPEAPGDCGRPARAPLGLLVCPLQGNFDAWEEMRSEGTVGPCEVTMAQVTSWQQ